ncbi:MAG: glycoside hydrolase family 15 protein [Gammaproteobacteria bacterium]|nr:glycoside hydrolase family 15 protein [Gammaproteobacteria bacterium]
MDAPRDHHGLPTWAPGSKDAVGTSLGSSRLWFTLAEAIVTEVYYPRLDIPQIKDLGFIVADDRGFWVELRKHADYTVALEDDFIPAVTITHRHERFRLRLRVCPHQFRDALLIDVALESEDETLRPYVLLAPRPGGDTERCIGEALHDRGRHVLWAEAAPFGVALAARTPEGRDAFARISAGCVGASDGWQDFNANGRMTREYDRAAGEVALMGELPRRTTLALGFGASKESAATLAAAALAQDFEAIWRAQIEAWTRWAATVNVPDLPEPLGAAFKRSAMVLKTHGDRSFLGAMVASLAVPWGETSTSRGGYHLVWPRDLVESAGALGASGACNDARDVLRYLLATQQADGHWHQNQWLGGKPFWDGIQLDETAFPVLLAGMLADADELAGIPVTGMVRRALAYLIAHGPGSAQDRWEEDAGINCFTLAIMIAALVEGAQFLDGAERELALLVADNWNARIEHWNWVEDSSLTERLGVPGYYLRIVPVETLYREDAKEEDLLIKNRSYDNLLPAEDQIATDFLQLVRYGLRRADDPKIVASVRAVDKLLRTETPNGPVWHRYNHDGYGEHKDGRPFDGTGHGRGWPLLTGERGHYALAAGEDPLPYLEAMAAMAGAGGMIPEQVWDAEAIPERGLYPGRPSGSAMPLVWAHGEFIKLAVSRERGEPCDRPARVWERYHGERPAVDWRLWTLHFRPRRIAPGEGLRLLLSASATVHWGVNGWQKIRDTETRDMGLGVHMATLPTRRLPAGSTVELTFRWRDGAKWQGEDYRVEIGT